VASAPEVDLNDQGRTIHMSLVWKIVAGLVVAGMGGLWLFGQDMLDQMALKLSAKALVLVPAATVVCAAAWWVRDKRRRLSGWVSRIEPGQRRDEILVLLGLSGVAFLFAFALDRLGHTPHATLFTAAVAAIWDSAGMVCMVFCGACLIGGGRK
jgi:hypothetical protein